MNKLLSRKFWLLIATYITVITFFALGKLPVNWFCGSLLAMSAFYYLANLLEKQIATLTKQEIIDLIKELT